MTDINSDELLRERKMARPRKTEKEKFSKQYSIRLPAEIEAEFTALAKKSGLTMSAFLRQVLTEDKSVEIIQIDTEGHKLWHRIFIHISKSTNNLNQIAKQLNRLYLSNTLSADNAAHYLKIIESIESQNHEILIQAKSELIK